MYKKKNREVNIFSASVVDLFASGLGVFLIVAIIALVNQKKETSASPDKTKNLEQKLAEAQNELEKLSQKQKETQSENIRLRAKKAELNDALELAEKSQNYRKRIIKEELKVKDEVELSNLASELEGVKKELQKQKKLNENLKQKIASTTATNNTPNSVAIKREAKNYNQYEIGSKFKLNNVQFYPGTDRPIEPYASHEIGSFAEFMRSHPEVMVEISGHIFETKDAIQTGQADDVYNLSVKRAKAVCKALVNFGVNQKRLNCVGYGASRPIVLTNNPYSEDAQKNRRVEVEILSK